MAKPGEFFGVVRVRVRVRVRRESSISK